MFDKNCISQVVRRTKGESKESAPAFIASIIRGGGSAFYVRPQIGGVHNDDLFL